MKKRKRDKKKNGREEIFFNVVIKFKIFQYLLLSSFKVNYHHDLYLRRKYLSF